MSRPAWFVELIKKAFPQRFTLAKLTRVPVVGNVVDKMLFNGDDTIYLPIDNTIQVNQPIERQQDVVVPSQIVEHFINNSKYHWVMDFCICRAGNQCEDYAQELGCLFLGEAVLDINPRFGRLVTKEQALEHARICRESGLVHMIGRIKLDSVWLGAGPSHKLLTICNCCPCCCIWKILPQIMPLIGDKVIKMPGVEVEVTELCVGCGICTEGVCFVDAIRLDAIRLEESRAVIGDSCRGCGRCVEVCPSDAIELSVSDDAFVQETIRRITPLVDLS